MNQIFDERVIGVPTADSLITLRNIERRKVISAQAAAPARQTVAVQVYAAIKHWENRTRIFGKHTDLTVLRRDLGRKKGFTVRLMNFDSILAEWRRPSENEAEECYAEVMSALMSLSGFRGITSSSHDEVMITSDMLADEAVKENED